jgi:hypothetical protein
VVRKNGDGGRHDSGLACKNNQFPALF